MESDNDIILDLIKEIDELKRERKFDRESEKEELVSIYTKLERRDKEIVKLRDLIDHNFEFANVLKDTIENRDKEIARLKKLVGEVPYIDFLN